MSGAERRGGGVEKRRELCKNVCVCTGKISSTHVHARYLNPCHRTCQRVRCPPVCLLCWGRLIPAWCWLMWVIARRCCSNVTEYTWTGREDEQLECAAGFDFLPRQGLLFKTQYKHRPLAYFLSAKLRADLLCPINFHEKTYCTFDLNC